jgi:hypothetical protein
MRLANRRVRGTAPFVALLLLLSAVPLLEGPSSDAAITSHVTSTSHSTKWSGYVLKSSSTYRIHYVDADVNVPNLDCSSSLPTTVDLWDGIGGTLATTSLAQAGVDASCVHGHATYSAWDEWYDPKKRNPEKPASGITIVANDEVNIGVEEVNPNRFLVTMLEWNPSNGDQAGYFKGSLTDPRGLPVGNTAECIVERPELVSHKSDSIGTFAPVTFNPCVASNQPNLISGETDVVTGVESQPTSAVFPVERINLEVATRVELSTSGPESEANPTSIGFTVHEPPSTGSSATANVRWEYAPGLKSGIRFETFEYAGDGTGELIDMTWSSWSALSAIGAGVDRVDNCSPDCASGSWSNYPVHVVFDHPIHVPCGSFYSEALFTFPSSAPSDAQGVNGSETEQLLTNFTSAAQLCS